MSRLTVIILLLMVLPHVTILGIVGLAARFVWGKASAAKGAHDAKGNE